MNLHNNIDRKINDYFNGQLSPQDEAELVHWLNSDNRNKEHFFNIKQNLNPQEIRHPLLESSFVELKSKIIINHGFNSYPKDRSRTLNFNLLRVAAMLVLALITGFSVAYLFIKPKTSNTEVVWFETQVPRGEKSQLILPDGSKVWVNSESKISYPSNFMDGDREIKLIGEAYFEVAKYKGKVFTVKTKDYDIRVLGTKFNVMAYPDFDRTETSLIEGKIEIQKETQTIPVLPGETFTYSENQYEIKEGGANQFSRWKDDIFDFDRVTFKELMVRLERWYDIEIEIKAPDLNNILYSGIFKNEESIEQVLNTVQLTIPIQYTRVDFRKFTIEKKK